MALCFFTIFIFFEKISFNANDHENGSVSWLTTYLMYCHQFGSFDNSLSDLYLNHRTSLHNDH